jgi:hypothetical protein
MSIAEITGTERTMADTAWIGGGRAAVALVALTAALLAAGALLLGAGVAPHRHGGAAARASIAFPGGVLRVDGVSEDHRMTAKDMGGMPMPKGPGVKDIPPGHRRFTITVTVGAEAPGGVHITPDRFRLAAPGAPPAAPRDDDRDDVFVPAGAAFARDLSFDVPQRARTAELTIRGGDRSIPLRLGAAPAAEGHGHQHG